MPLVIRGPNGAAHMLGAQHSQSLDHILASIPGLIVVSSAIPNDAKGLMKSAIRDNNPVMFLESELLYGKKGDVQEGEYSIPLGVGDIKRPGTDLTLVAWNKMTYLALDVAEKLQEE